MNELEAGRELDALIAEKVMGIDVARGVRVMHDCGSEWDAPGILGTGGPLGEGLCYDPVPFYSRDIAAAWEVVEKMGDAFDGLYPSFDDGRLCYWVAVTDLSPREPRRGHIADTAPLAICRAALAIAAEVTQ